jgi:hypothetical protein
MLHFIENKRNKEKIKIQYHRVDKDHIYIKVSTDCIRKIKYSTGTNHYDNNFKTCITLSLSNKTIGEIELDPKFKLLTDYNEKLNELEIFCLYDSFLNSHKFQDKLKDIPVKKRNS